MKQKLFTFFAALLLTGSMSAVNLNKLTYVEAVMDQEANTWIFIMYETKPTTYDYTYPYVYITVPAKSETAIAGTYHIEDPLNVEYDTSDEDFIYAKEVSDLAISFIEKGLYHYSFTFTCMDEQEYIIDIDLPTEAHYNMGDAIELTDGTEGIEDLHVDSEKAVKVLNDGHIYILRGEKGYTLKGQEVK